MINKVGWFKMYTGTRHLQLVNEDNRKGLSLGPRGTVTPFSVSLSQARHTLPAIDVAEILFIIISILPCLIGPMQYMAHRFIWLLN